MKFYIIYITSTGYDIEIHNKDQVITLGIGDIDRVDDLVFILDSNGFVDKSEED